MSEKRRDKLAAVLRELGAVDEATPISISKYSISIAEAQGYRPSGHMTIEVSWSEPADTASKKR